MSSSPHKLCTSLLPASMDELKTWMADTGESDIIEVRLDNIATSRLKPIRALTDKPLIITLRSKSEGGHWQDTDEKYLKIYQAAVNTGVEYLDVEFTKAALLSQLKRKKTRIILSHHTTLNQPAQLKKILKDMLAVEADVYKLIFTAATLNDNLTALELIERAAAQNVQFIIHAMEEIGEVSRILGALHGNAWTYTAQEYAQETAPGQLTIHNAKSIYHLDREPAETRILGLVGSPIQQSKGWKLHNWLIQEKAAEITELNGDKNFIYANFPAEDMDAFWDAWHPRIHGLSVTLPHKEKVVPYLDELSTEVRISGTCNTIVRTDKGWKGHNTDLLAIEALLRPHFEKLRGGGLVIGTGATARTAIAVLKRLEVNPIFIVGRNEKRGRYLSSLYGIEYLLESEIHYATATVIIQATPVGMAPYTDAYPTGTALFRKNRVVLDVIYNPVETRYLQIAKERGCLPISGMDMFLLQAAKQFEIFTGVTVSPQEIKNIWKRIH